jgi:hypothetical protein
MCNVVPWSIKYPWTKVTLICVTGTPRSEYQHLPRNLRSGRGGVIVISLVHIDDSFSVIFRYTLENFRDGAALSYAAALLGVSDWTDGCTPSVIILPSKKCRYKCSTNAATAVPAGREKRKPHTRSNHCAIVQSGIRMASNNRIRKYITVWCFWKIRILWGAVHQQVSYFFDSSAQNS